MKFTILTINLLGLFFTASFFLFDLNLIGDPFLVFTFHLFLGVFQMILSIVYVFQRKKTNLILDIHLGFACLCLLALFISSLENTHMSEGLFFGVFPTFAAIIFTYGAWNFKSNPNENKRKVKRQIVEF